MTDQEYTHICMVVDRSGSMSTIASDMEGGIKTLLADQAKEPGYCLVDIVTFDTEVEFPFIDCRPDDVKGEIIRPRSSTALNDAVGMSIVRLGEKFARMAEEDRPAHVIFVVVTDGMENASREYTKEQVKALVEMQTEQYGWHFLYLAANVDAFATGADYGFAPSSTMPYNATAKGSKMSMASASRSMSATRSGLDADFTEEERKEAARHE